MISFDIINRPTLGLIIFKLVLPEYDQSHKGQKHDSKGHFNDADVPHLPVAYF